MSERASGEDTEPDLHLIEPAAVLGGKDEGDAGVLGKPEASVVACARADVVGDDDERSTTVEGHELIEEKQDLRPRPLGGDPDQDMTGLDVEG